MSYAFTYLILKPVKTNSNPRILWVIVRIYEENFLWYTLVLHTNLVVFHDMPTCPKLDHFQESPLFLYFRLSGQKWNSWHLEKVKWQKVLPFEYYHVNIIMGRGGNCGMQTLMSSVLSSLFHVPHPTLPPGYQTRWWSNLKPINRCRGNSLLLTSPLLNLHITSLGFIWLQDLRLADFNLIFKFQFQALMLPVFPVMCKSHSYIYFSIMFIKILFL